MNYFHKKMMKLRERYIDTLGKLYEYSTAMYENNLLSKMIGSDMGYTYKEFKKKCDELSSRLSRYGIGAGDRPLPFFSKRGMMAPDTPGLRPGRNRNRRKQNGLRKGIPAAACPVEGED